MITISTELYPSINVNLDKITRIILKQCGGGLYYYDMTSKDLDKGQTMDYIFLSILRSNKPCFHQIEIKRTDEARILQRLVGWTTTQTLKEPV